MVNGLRITRENLRHMVVCLGREWIVRLVHESNSGPVITRHYNGAQLINAAGFLRKRNSEGYNCYGRPISNGYLLVDDVCVDDLDAMHKDGLRPTIAVQTSPHNFQAWLTLSHEEIDEEVARHAAKILAGRYNGDSNSAKPEQLGRLPGLTNRKPMYENEGKYPFAHVWKPGPFIAQNRDEILDEAYRRAETQQTPSPASPLGGCVPILVSDDNFDELSAIYEEAYDAVAERFGNRIPTLDRSSIDYSVARNLHMSAIPTMDIAHILLAGSEKGRERGLEYCLATARAASRS